MANDTIKYAIHKTNPKTGETANRFKLGFDNLTKDEAADLLMVLAKMQTARAENQPWVWPYVPDEVLVQSTVTMPEFLEAADDGFATGTLTYPIPSRDGNHLPYRTPVGRERRGEDN